MTGPGFAKSGPGPERFRVGVIGLGEMGSGMASRLLRSGLEVAVYNRTRERTRFLVEQGARVASSPRALARASDVVLTAVHDVAALEAVLLGPDGAFAGARPGTLFVDSTTVRPDASRAMAQMAAERHCDYVEAPLLGSRDAAAAGRLFFLVGGAPEACERAAPLFAAMGRGTRIVGPVGAASTLKLVINMIAALVVIALAEGAAVTEAAGIGLDLLHEALRESVVNSRLVDNKLPKIRARDFSPQARLALYEKDVRYFINLTADLAQQPRAAAYAPELLGAACAAGWGDADLSALYAYVVGLPPDRPPRSPAGQSLV